FRFVLDAHASGSRRAPVGSRYRRHEVNEVRRKLRQVRRGWKGHHRAWRWDAGEGREGEVGRGKFLTAINIAPVVNIARSRSVICSTLLPSISPKSKLVFFSRTPTSLLPIPQTTPKSSAQANVSSNDRANHPIAIAQTGTRMSTWLLSLSDNLPNKMP